MSNKSSSESTLVKSLYKKYLINCGYIDNKVEVLFNYWIDNLLYVISKYNENELILFKQNLSKNPNLFRVIDSRLKKEVFKNSFFFKKKLYNFFGFLYLKFVKNIFISGSEYSTNRINYRFSQYAIIYLSNNIEYDYQSKIIFKKKLIKNFNNSKFIELVSDFLPDYFFCNPYFINKSINFIGSPTFFLNPKFSKILFIRNSIKIFGIQHGSNYGLFKNNFFENFELDISDKYYYWLMSNSPLKITRFKKYHSSLNMPKKIFWIGRTFVNDYLKFSIPGLTKYDGDEEIKLINLIEKNLNFFEYLFIPATNSNTKNLYYKTVPNSKVFRPNCKIEHFFKNINPILIFDVLNSTLIYYAINSDMPFLVFANQYPKKFQGKYYDEYVLLLKQMDVLFYDIDLFQSELEKLIFSVDFYNEKSKKIMKIRKHREKNLIV